MIPALDPSDSRRSSVRLSVPRDAIGRYRAAMPRLSLKPASEPVERRHAAGPEQHGLKAKSTCGINVPLAIIDEQALPGLSSEAR